MASPAPAGIVGHGHLWKSSDGTGLHAPAGAVVRDPDTGEACCHLCGRWYRALGSHVRVHGYSAATYRQAVGLSKTRPLAAPLVTSAISRRQTAAYAASPHTQAAFAIGHHLARTGKLAELSRAANSVRRAETDTITRSALQAGRTTSNRRRVAEREARLAALGATSLDDYLRTAYADGASLEQLAATAGLGRAQLRDAMAAAHITIRPQGANTARGKRSRARTADTAAADRVGTDDIVSWLLERRARGSTLTDLAVAVGHSTHWVQWRLQDQTGPRAPCLTGSGPTQPWLLNPTVSANPTGT